MKHIKKIVIGTLIIGTATLGASAYANKGDGFQQRMIERVAKRLDLNDVQQEALNGLTQELSETRELMRGQQGDMRTEIVHLLSAPTLDQGKALSLIIDRAAALQNNAPELVAAAAVFFDGLDETQKEKISKFAKKLRRGHKH